MPESKAWEQLTALLNIEELGILLNNRATLRLMYAELQTAAHATNNPLFENLMDAVLLQGKHTNVAIQDWFDRVQLQHGGHRPNEWGIAPDGSLEEK